MKRLLTTSEYYFNAGSNNIDFSNYPDFDPKRLLAVINTSRNQTLIYATGGGNSSPVRGEFTGAVGSYFLSLVFDTTSMADTDTLQIIYDEPVGVEEAKASVDIVSGKSGLDINLLNSSFGGTVGDVMPAPFQDNALSIGVLNGGVLESPAMNVNNELIVDITQSGPINVNQQVGGVAPTSGQGPTDIGTQRVSANIYNNGSNISYGAGATDSNTQRVTANINQISDIIFTGTPQSASQNNIISGGPTATDCLGYRSFSAQLVCTATAGTMFFEGSNDNVSFQAIPVFNQSSTNVTPFTTAITASVSNFIYTGSLPFRFLRIRIASSLTGGTVTAHVKLSPIAFVPTVMAVGQNNASNLLASISGSLTAVTTVSAVNSCALNASQTTDVASAAITSSATSANFNISQTQSASFGVFVTAISGANAAMDVQIQESMDGTSYYTIYTFERITATGQYYSPVIKHTAANLRYIRTLSGTTPSVTNSINRITRSGNAQTVRRFYDRAINPNTLNSTSGVFFCEGVSNFNLIARCTAQTTPATIALQFSVDGSNWFTTATTVATDVGIVRASCVNEHWKFVRAIATSAGTGITLDYLHIAGQST